MARGALGIIGGTGLARVEGLAIDERREQPTPWGTPSAPLLCGTLGGTPVVFLRRHGENHDLPPHRINYRANVWALREAGARTLVGVAAVGGIAADASPGRLVFPQQLVDYTYGREHTFFAEDLAQVVHVDFTEPYSARLRECCLRAAQIADLDACPAGTYAATQGPRLETAAEIARLERDGCTVVGMTGMPEAALARELELDYACCAVVVNRAAGKAGGPITMADIEANLAQGMRSVGRWLNALAGLPGLLGDEDRP